MTAPLLALDVDGVLNIAAYSAAEADRPAGTVRREVTLSAGARAIIDYRPEVIEALDNLVTSGKVELGWLTTWGAEAPGALAPQAFDGQLGGGTALAEMPRPRRLSGTVSPYWKFLALRQRIYATRQPWVWVDDEAIRYARARRHRLGSIASQPGLCVEPDMWEGLQPSDVDRIREWVKSL